MAASKASWAIATYLRIRPLPRESAEEIEYDIEHVALDDRTKRSIIQLTIPFDADPGLVHNNSATGCLKYEFDDVFGPLDSQETVFNAVASSKVIDVIDGVNCTIFAYGQTGSGKTYSIFGGETYQERGLIPRTISLLFSTLRERQAQLSFKCTVSFTEIYKETVYDLLDASKRSTPIEAWNSVQVFEGEQGIILRNLNVFVVSNEQEALKLFFLGAANRVTSSTAMNLVSSRSHAVFTMLVETEGVRDQRTVYTSGKVNLVDLAGSERVYKLHNTPDSIKEAKAINLSLHFLEHVILALRDQHNHATTASSSSLSPPSSSSDKNQRTGYVPYRNSVLTNMLRDSLGGNCRSSFLLTVTPQRSHFEECVATCRFGQRCGEVKVVVQANSEIGLSDQLRDMAARHKALERQLATAEEQRSVLENVLREERLFRQQQTSLRALSSQEKNICTQCVQDLLNSARTFVDGIRDGDGSGGAKEAEALVEASQDALYKAVEGLDKAVLVELGTALGGLVQSIFVEFQLAKKEAAFKERQRLAAEQQEAQRKDYERRLQDQLLVAEDVALLPRLPDRVVQGLLEGAVFLKRDRMGREAPRFVCISEDLRSILWEPLGASGGAGNTHNSSTAHTSGGGGNGHERQQSAPLGAFTGVDVDGKGGVAGLLIMRPTPGSTVKVLHLQHVDSRGLSFVEWLRALQYLVAKAKTS